MADLEPDLACPGCRALRAVEARLAAEVAALRAEVAELKRRLGEDSRNSNKPPSSDSPWRPKPALPKPKGRKRGGQPGHEGRTRPLLEPEEVDEIVECRPAQCGGCGATLEGADPRPLRRQVADVPQVRPVVTEYRLHGLRCACCGDVTRGGVPTGVPNGAFGPRARAIAALLTGAHRLSRRAAEQLMSDLFGLSISLGSISNLEADMVDALAAPFAEACQAARSAPCLHADETGWAECDKLVWLWVLSTASATIFLVRKRRDSGVARELLGMTAGIVVTDRWSAYTWLPLRQRQLCWAHLIRDFRKLSECPEPVATHGHALLERAQRLFHLWHRVRDGTLRRSSFQTYVVAIRRDVRKHLDAARNGGHEKAASLCRGILAVEPAMWTFVRVAGVEPTNNRAERALRPVVLWRNSSHGSRSAVGHAFVERMLTTVATLRQFGRNVLDFLYQATVAALSNSEPPHLIPAVATPTNATVAA